MELPFKEQLKPHLVLLVQVLLVVGSLAQMEAYSLDKEMTPLFWFHPVLSLEEVLQQ